MEALVSKNYHLLKASPPDTIDEGPTINDGHHYPMSSPNLTGRE